MAINFGELILGTILTNEENEDFTFISHCLCDNPENPILYLTKNGKEIITTLTSIQETWKIKN